MLFEEHYGSNAVPHLLVGWCAVLLISGAWLNHVLFRRVKIRLPLVAAVLGIAAILPIWLWQRLAYKSLVPATGLIYGYFLTPEGAHAHLWALTCPFWVGAACLTVCCVAALISGWRAGLRLSLLCLIPWWLSAMVIFSLPSMFLDAQGNVGTALVDLRHENAKTTQRSYTKTLPSVVTEAMKRLEQGIACAADVHQVSVNLSISS